MRKLLHGLDRGLCRLANRVIFRLKRVECLTDLANINGTLRIAGHGRISIGAGTRMNSGPRRNPIGGDTKLTLVCRHGGEIEIGPDCGLSNCAIVADSKVVLEAEVMIGGGVKIYDTDFHNVDPELRRAERAGTYHGVSRPVLIRRNAFIGAHAIILKGVTVGENSVVGAGSVVSRDIPDNEIWAGNPAALVRRMTQS